MIVKTINIIEAADPNGQSLAVKNWFFIKFPIIIVFAPPIKSEMKNKPKVGMKTNIEAATIPGIVNGTVTLVNTCHGLAPKSLAASR